MSGIMYSVDMNDIHIRIRYYIRFIREDISANLAPIFRPVA
jgi:hypothetical protein